MKLVQILVAVVMVASVCVVATSIHHVQKKHHKRAGQKRMQGPSSEVIKRNVEDYKTHLLQYECCQSPNKKECAGAFPADTPYQSCHGGGASWQRPNKQARASSEACCCQWSGEAADEPYQWEVISCGYGEYCEYNITLRNSHNLRQKEALLRNSHNLRQKEGLCETSANIGSNEEEYFDE